MKEKNKDPRDPLRIHPDNIKDNKEERYRKGKEKSQKGLGKDDIQGEENIEGDANFKSGTENEKERQDAARNLRNDDRKH